MGSFRANLEETGMGFGLEIDCIAAAHKIGMLTTPYAFDPDQAADLTRAGCRHHCGSYGTDYSGTIGASTALTLDECVPQVAAIAEAALRVRSDVFVLCHGGLIRHARRCSVYAQSSGFHSWLLWRQFHERLPTEIALKAQVQDFTRIRMKK